MANYKGIKGFKVQSLASDPTASASTAGQVWYNTTSNTLKVALDGGAPIGTWASGGTINTMTNDGAGAGTNTAGLAFGGAIPASPYIGTQTETYNGTAWTEVNDLNTEVRSQSGTGSQTAALSIAGGEAPNFTAGVEDYNGTSWTEVASLNLARGYNPGSSGTITAALCIGGKCDTPSPSTTTAAVEDYNGTCWTEVNALNAVRFNGAGAGVQSSTLYAGGGNGSPTLDTNESYDGTSWSEEAVLNTGRNALGGSGDTNTDVLVFGGVAAPGETPKTEAWNGTAWTEVADLSAPTADFSSSAPGGGTSALKATGNVNDNRSAATESWNAAAYQTKTVTIS
jgi:hypothetical protein